MDPCTIAAIFCVAALIASAVRPVERDLRRKSDEVDNLRAEITDLRREVRRLRRTIKDVADDLDRHG